MDALIVAIGVAAVVIAVFGLGFGWFALSAKRIAPPSSDYSPLVTRLTSLEARVSALELQTTDQHQRLTSVIARERTAAARARKSSEPMNETPDEWRERMNAQLARRFTAAGE